MIAYQLINNNLVDLIARIPAGSIVESADGYKWNCGGPDTDDHLALGGHEVGLEGIIASMSDPNRVSFNIGSHIGSWAIRMTKYCTKVYAFEANYSTAVKCQQNAMLNGVDEKVIIYPIILWDNDTDLLELIDVNGKRTGGSTRAQKIEQRSMMPPLRALGNRLDGFDLPEPGFILMDVEGAEARILRGARETIAKARPNMIIELHENHPGTDPDLRDQVYSVLNELNYDYHSVDITGERLLCFPKEKALDEMLPA